MIGVVAIIVDMAIQSRSNAAVSAEHTMEIDKTVIRSNLETQKSRWRTIAESSLPTGIPLHHRLAIFVGGQQ